MRPLNLAASYCILLAVALCSPQVAPGQYSISSIAGGGPNNLPALKSSIGYAVGVALDSAGNTYIADSYSSQIFQVSASGTLTVVAGNGTLGYSGDGGPATSAALNRPQGIFVDSSGNIFLADTDNSVIREVVASTGNIQTVAGNGTAGFFGDGNPATGAHLNDPFGVFVDSSGNIFIADTDNSVIREVLASTGNIQTVAGNFTLGAGYSGDAGLATSAQLDQPQSVFVDAVGNIFIADTYNSVIREVTSSNGNIQTVAGVYYAWNDSCKFSGDGAAAASAQLCLPNAVLLDGSGNIFIADTQNSAIRVVNTGTTPLTIDGVPIPAGAIQTVAGNATLGSGYSGNGGLATDAQLNYPSGAAVDSSENIFIADTDNFVVREVTASTGDIQTVIGNNTPAYSGDGGSATSADLNAPGGTFVDGSGNIFVADTYNSVIRVVNPRTQPVTIAGVAIQPGDIQTVAGNGTAGYSGDGGAPTSAELFQPQSVFVDGSGNIFIADTGNSAIRVVNTGSSQITIAGVAIPAGDIQTVAGTPGTAGYSGDGGAPTSAELSSPYGVVVDGSGNIFIADTENSAVRVVNTGTTPLTIAGVAIPAGAIQTVAGKPPKACADSSSGCGDNGPATSASLNFPVAISLDGAEDIFIADTFNSAIRVVNPGTQPVTIAGTVIPPGDILTVAGTLGQDGYSGDNGPPASAALNAPYGVSVDSLGNIFIADTDNSAIREVVNVAATIQTIAGNGTGVAGFSGDGGSANSAALNSPESMALGGSGSIFVADSENSRVRQLTSTVSVSVVPASATVPVSLTQQFLATVTGASNTNVTWQVNGVTSGNSTLGTISAAGLYQAPATPPSSAITVTAISDANGTTSASAQVTIAASGAPAVTISTTPSGVTVVYTSTTQTFSATVTGETNTAVNWEVNGVASGNATFGTIDATGLYSAPAAVSSPSLVVITAVSQADSTVSGSYPITMVTAPAAAQPAPQTISAGGTANYSLSLNANTGSPHQPITLSCLQSSLPAGASCTFSPPTITPSSSAVSFALAVNVPSSSASFGKPGGLWLAPQIYFAFIPLAGILVLGAKRGKQRRRWLWLALTSVCLLALIACGGSGSSSSRNPVTYTIQVQGKTAAQPNPVTITTASLTVQ
jgi:protein gp37